MRASCNGAIGSPACLARNRLTACTTACPCTTALAECRRPALLLSPAAALSSAKNSQRATSGAISFVGIARYSSTSGNSAGTCLARNRAQRKRCTGFVSPVATGWLRRFGTPSRNDSAFQGSLNSMPLLRAAFPCLTSRENAARSATFRRTWRIVFRRRWSSSIAKPASRPATCKDSASPARRTGPAKLLAR